MQRVVTDFLVVGGGVAGLQAAIAASAHGRVVVANKGDGCSTLAQGGVAVALDEPDEGRGHWRTPCAPARGSATRRW